MLLLFTVLTSLVLVRRRDPLARRFPAIMLGAAVTEWTVKWLVARPRPRGSPTAFPSGHVFTSVAFFGAVVYLLWTRDVARPWRIKCDWFLPMARTSLPRRSPCVIGCDSFSRSTSNISRR